LYLEVWHLARRAAAATEIAPPACRPDAIDAMSLAFPNQFKALLTSCRELSLARRTAAATSENGMAAANGRDIEAPAAGPLVILGEPGDKPIVNGKAKKRLLLTQFHVIKALTEAGKNGLSKDELIDKSGHGDAVNILKRLADRDADWKSVIQLGEIPGGRYRISS
jgi:hypothetical protein